MDDIIVHTDDLKGVIVRIVKGTFENEEAYVVPNMIFFLTKLYHLT